MSTKHQPPPLRLQSTRPSRMPGRSTKAPTPTSTSFTPRTPLTPSSPYSLDDECLLQLYGTCARCGRANTGQEWCSPCVNASYRDENANWTSGNPSVDAFIRDAQATATNGQSFLEWIPWNQLEKVKMIGKGGIGSVASATWTDGPILRIVGGKDGSTNGDEKIDDKTGDETGKKSGGLTRAGKTAVALRILDKSRTVHVDFFNEIRALRTCTLSYGRYGNYGNCITRCFGITQNPKTREYVMVREYAESNLRDYLLNGNAGNWLARLIIVRDVASGLHEMHKSGIVHRNLHSGNVLQNGDCSTISDLAISSPRENDKSMTQRTDRRQLYGVLPYVAPEVLQRRAHTAASDVYSLGILMWEVSCCAIPYADTPHNVKLARDLCNGERPKIVRGTPSCYVTLMKRCWDVNPANRPRALEVRDAVSEWVSDILQERESPHRASFRVADKQLDKSHPPAQRPKKHAQAIYSGRILNFMKLGQS